MSRSSRKEKEERKRSKNGRSDGRIRGRQDDAQHCGEVRSSLRKRENDVEEWKNICPTKYGGICFELKRNIINDVAHGMTSVRIWVCVFGYARFNLTTIPKLFQNTFFTFITLS
uniref:DUF4283 domain-containing protein n=1 Tax=Caenorhabditis tropicalis TaxID=1561998 RepID=A0A1I7U0M8_9PELO